MTTSRISEPKESMKSLQSRLEEDGYLFFPRISLSPPIKFLCQFGRHRLQGDGQPYNLVKAGEKLQPNDGGSLMPHTDDFNSERLPPRLVALYCVQPDKQGYGQTLIGDGYSWLDTLPDTTLQLLKRRWQYRKRDRVIKRPFLSATQRGRVLRVSYGHLIFTHNENMKSVMAELSQWFVKEAIAVSHRRGSLLLWNNWRMIHGRGSYLDLRRELHRYHID